MRTIRACDFVRDDYGRLAVAIGNFDGVHLGHQRVLRTARLVADDRGLTLAALTFEPHPVRVLNPAKDLKLIYPYSKKYELMAEIGLDLIIVWQFTLEFARTSCDRFVRDVLCDRLGAAVAVVGHNFSFGLGGRGGPDELKTIGARHGLDVVVVEPYRRGGRVVSSSLIRGLVASGQLEEAAALLGRPFSVIGEVVRGHERGRGLMGIPTANLVPAELVPLEGVYVSSVRIGDEVFPAAAHVGPVPTFGQSEFVVEVHIIDLPDMELYGLEVEVFFFTRIRDVVKCRSVDELKRLIESDLDRVRRYFRDNPSLLSVGG